jgi:hypothetical protein
MNKTAIWSILLALGQLNSTSRDQSQEDIAKQFAGLWRLVSNPQRLIDGTTREGFKQRRDTPRVDDFTSTWIASGCRHQPVTCATYMGPLLA